MAEDSKEIGSDLKKQKPLGSNPDSCFSSLQKPSDFLVSNGSPVVTIGGGMERCMAQSFFEKTLRIVTAF